MPAATTVNVTKPQVPWAVWLHWSKNQRNQAMNTHELLPQPAKCRSTRFQANGWDRLSTFDKDGKPLD